MRKFVLIFLFFSCEKLDTLGPNPTGMELSTAMEKWDNKNFNNYEYSLDVSCYCIYDGPNNIEIKNNDLFKVNGKSVTLEQLQNCLLYTSPSPRDATLSRMPSSA